MDIREIIRTARSITDSEIPGLIVSREETIASYGGQVDQKAEESIAEFKGKYSGGFKVVQVTPPLLELAKEKSGKTIMIRKVDSEEDNPIYGYVKTSDKEAIISYRSNLNICWKRFTVAKELFHIYMGISECRRNSSEITQAAMVARKTFPYDNTQVDDEVAAFYLALEYLIPWKLREQFAWLREHAATMYQIAKVFMIPLPFVEHLCEGGYASMSHIINSNI